MASFVNMSGKTPERSSFAQTCNLLSQYLKRRGGLEDVSQLGINGKPESKGLEASRQPTTTMNLLSNLEKVHDSHQKNSSIGKSSTVDSDTARMTIFYGGQVIVFNDFPADKAKQIMSLASNSNGFIPASTMEAHNPKGPTATDSNNAPDLLQLQPPQTNDSGLPIARRASLHRFFEKRKDRIASKAPYQRNSPSAATSKPVVESSPLLELEGLSSKQLELRL